MGKKYIEWICRCLFGGGTELKTWMAQGMIGVSVQTVRPDKRRVYPEIAEGIIGRVHYLWGSFREFFINSQGLIPFTFSPCKKNFVDRLII